MRKVYKPFLKWVGGKSNLVDQILTLVPKEFKTYHEPFVGGGAVFWALQTNNLTKSYGSSLSDANYALMTAWRDVRNMPDTVISGLEFIERLYHRQDPEDLYYRVRAAWNLGDKTTERFIFLKQTGFNGMWRENKKGEYNVPWGKYKTPNICPDGIKAASDGMYGAGLFHSTWAVSLGRPDPGDFCYLDPPYLGTFTGYTKESFSVEDQIALLKRCRELSQRDVYVLCSNTMSDSMDDLLDRYWPEAERITVSARRSVSCKKDGRQSIDEYLIRSPNYELRGSS